jgi:hypothetical protein
VISRLRIGLSLAAASGYIGAPLYLYSVPALDGSSVQEYLKSDPWSWLWALSLPCGAYFIFAGVLLLLGVLFHGHEGLRIKNKDLIFLFPFFLQIPLSEIKEVVPNKSATIAKWVRNTLIVMRNGRKRLIWQSFLSKPSEEVAREIREAISRELS